MLKLRIPPPIVGFSVALGIYALQQLLPQWRIDSTAVKVVALAFVVVGILIELWSVGLFIHASTTVNPLKPERSNHLVTTGMYRYTRNPMYLGMLTLLFGFVLWIGNPIGLPMLLVFVWYITRFQIKPEEEILLNLFGENFANYKKRVRRWI